MLLYQFQKCGLFHTILFARLSKISHARNKKIKSSFKIERKNRLVNLLRTLEKRSTLAQTKPYFNMRAHLTHSALAFFIFGSILSGCIKNEAKQPTKQSTADSTLALEQGTLQVNNITLAGAPGVDTLTINTSMAWQAAASASWLHLDATKGTGVYQLKISADTNRTGNVLTGTVTITAAGNSSVSPVTLSVKQNPYHDTGWVQLTTSSGLTTNAQPGLTFTYNGSLYFGWSLSNDNTIYRLDTTTNKWVAAITIPSTIQVIQQPTYFFLGNKLYIGGGYSTTALSFYEYDLTQGNSAAAWRTLTPLPETMINGIGFAIGNNGYVQGGGLNKLYQFSLTGPSDPGTWTSLGTFSEGDGQSTSFVLGNTVYFGGGSVQATNETQAEDFYSITPPSTTISSIAPIPDNVSISPGQRFTTWTQGNIAWLYDSYVLAVYTYDPSANSWTKITTIPTTGRVEYAYENNGHIYAWDDSGVIWEYLGQ